MKAQLNVNATSQYLNAEPRNPVNHDLKVGEKVFHQKFGYGHITDIDADTIEVYFDKSGDKKVKASYLLSKESIP